jgi:hypothetical protein
MYKQLFIIETFLSDPASSCGGSSPSSTILIGDNVSDRDSIHLDSDPEEVASG